MKYTTFSAVWELTMACNMRCKHCGSSCETAYTDELTTTEALNLCDELKELGFKYITLSGGELTVRKDWNLIAKKLSDNGIIPNMITNGWLMNKEIIEKAIESKIGNIGISIDGLENTHDFMRRTGSFNQSMKAFELMKHNNLKFSAITTINKKNILELSELRELLIEKGVTAWQIQFGLPMGNLAQNSELVLEPDQIDTIIDFVYENLHDDRISIYLADCIGYYNKKEIEIKKKVYKNSCFWNGCKAGKTLIGILNNGDIVGCTSIRNKEFIEGNIRKTPLKDLWSNSENFKWNREMKKDLLQGFCGKCIYGEYCLGGCSNTKLCTKGNIYEENKYCSYSVRMNNIKNNLEEINDSKLLIEKIKDLINKKKYQIAELIISKYFLKNEADIEILNLYNFINLKLHNYKLVSETCEKLLKLDPTNKEVLNLSESANNLLNRK